MPKSFKIWPMMQNFTKSGHTGWNWRNDSKEKRPNHFCNFFLSHKKCWLTIMRAALISAKEVKFQKVKLILFLFRLFKIQHVQCDQIVLAIFVRPSYKLSYKSSPNIWWISGIFEKCHDFCKNCSVYFFGKLLWKIGII